MGEVLLEQDRHVGEQPSAVRHGSIGMGARPCARALSPRLLRKLAHGEAVSDVPGDPRQLAGAVGGADDEAGERVAPRNTSKTFPGQALARARGGTSS